MEEPWRAAPLLRLLIPGLAMPANVSAQAQSRLPAYARKTTSALWPMRQSHLEALGATRWDHQTERGFDFWVLRDPWGNEFCVLHPSTS